jgi:hypothetical protein
MLQHYNIDNYNLKMLGYDSVTLKGSSCEMETLVDLVNGNVEMAKWGLDSRSRIGASGAKLRRMVVHMATRFYINSRTTIYNNNKILKLNLK